MTYEIRAMSIGEVLDTGFRLVRDHFVQLVGISLAVALPAELLSRIVTNLQTSPDATAIVGLVGLLIVVVVVSPIVNAAITHAVSEVYQGREASFGASMRVGLKLLLPLMGTSLLMTLFMMIGFMLFIIPGIYLACAWMLTYQVMVIERCAGWTALKRTRELSRGHLLRIIGVFLVGIILMFVIGGVLSLVTGSVPILSTLVAAATQAIFSAFLAAAFVVVYFDIRCRKEAFDLEHLAGLVTAADSAGAPAVELP